MKFEVNSNSVQDSLRELIYQAILAATGGGKDFFKIDDILIEHPKNESFGDYSTNIAMTIFSKIKMQKSKCKIKMQNSKLKEGRIKNPLELAGMIVGEIKKNSKSAELLSKIEVAPPGFINFWLSKETLSSQASRLLSTHLFTDCMGKLGKNRLIVIDYSAPNIAKPFGIGHLRSTNIGQAIYNLYKFLGWKTVGDNHLGDWGTQFGKLIYQIELKIKNEKLKIGDLKIEDLEKLYVEFHKEAEKRPELEGEARKWFKKLEDGDPEAKKIWQFCIDVSLKEFDRVYDLLGVQIDYAFGESFYHFEGWMDRVLEDVKAKGLLRESQGALVIKLPRQKVPGMLVKSDGGTTYLLRDLATIKFRVEKWHPDLFVYEVGADQKLHFQQIFEAAELLGYVTADKLVHVAHGMIRWAHGKFSTRKGDTIHLDQVIKDGIERARQLIEKSATDKKLTEKEKEKIAKAVGVGGIKFNDLKQEPQKDIIFDWEKILALEGYSAPYLQYTYARAQSVLAKAEINSKFETLNSKQTQNSKFKIPNNLENEELALLRTFYKFPEVIVEAAKQFSPHVLCQYLFDLAQKFNLFYQKCRILGEIKNQNSKIKITSKNLKLNQKSEIILNSSYLIANTSSFRLMLTQVTANVLKMGLEILGIEVLNKM